jgi:hypothetical protein
MSGNEEVYQATKGDDSVTWSGKAPRATARAEVAHISTAARTIFSDKW